VSPSRPGWRATPRVGATALVLAALAGCALPPPAPAPPPVPRAAATVAAPAGRDTLPRGATPVGTTASGGTIGARAAPAVVDSGPSAAALEVLRGIPEPLAADQRVPPADDLVRARAAPAASDTVPNREEIPVPSPTLPLGSRPGGLQSEALPESPFAPAARPPAAAPPESAAAAPDTCWRVQVAAPDTAEKAQALRAAAESLLLTPMVVEEEAGRWKVRTRDCLARAGAEALRKRALGSGFDGAFLVSVKRP